MKKAVSFVVAATCGLIIVACGHSKDEIEAREKARMDSLAAVEKAKIDSLVAVEKAKIDSLAAVEKARTDSLSAIKTTENAIMDSLRRPILQHPRENDFLWSKQVWMKPRRIIIK